MERLRRCCRNFQRAVRAGVPVPRSRGDDTGTHVDEGGVTARPFRQLAHVQHRRDRRPLGVRIVGVECLEETGSQAVAAELEVAELPRNSSVRTNPASTIWRSSL